MHSAQVRLFVWSCEGFQRQSRLSAQCGRQSPDSLELLEKKNLKPEQVENGKEVLVMKAVPEREVPCRWAEWGGRSARALAHPNGLLSCSGSEWEQAAAGRGPAFPGCLALGTPSSMGAAKKGTSRGLFGVRSHCTYLHQSLASQGPGQQPDSLCRARSDMREKVLAQLLHWYFLVSECVCRWARRLERSAKALLQ